MPEQIRLGCAAPATMLNSARPAGGGAPGPAVRWVLSQPAVRAGAEFTGRRGLRTLAARGTSQEGLAARYAAALFDLADEHKQLDVVADDLRAVSRLVGESPDLRRMLASPVLSRQAQGRAMAA